MLREMNGAGNRIAPRGGEFPLFPPRGPNAGRVSACHRFPRFAGVGVARATAHTPSRRRVALPAPGGVLLCMFCFCSYPHVKVF